MRENAKRVLEEPRFQERLAAFDKDAVPEPVLRKLQRSVGGPGGGDSTDDRFLWQAPTKMLDDARICFYFNINMGRALLAHNYAKGFKMRKHRNETRSQSVLSLLSVSQT